MEGGVRIEDTGYAQHMHLSALLNAGRRGFELRANAHTCCSSSAPQAASEPRNQGKSLLWPVCCGRQLAITAAYRSNWIRVRHGM